MTSTDGASAGGGSPWAVPPATVYLPTTGSAPDGEQQVVVREIADAELAVVGYSSLEQLVACCGHDQPWVELPWDVVEDLRQQLDALVVLDTPVYDTLEQVQRARGGPGGA